jgi:uncharacterized protein (DUF58 family)
MISSELAKKVNLIKISTRKAVTATFAGEYASVFKGRGMEFDEVREYEIGDDIRAIDWNVTARTGTLHTKRFLEERELTVLFLVDLSGSESFGSTTRTKGEIAAEISALLALSAVKNNDRVGLIIFTDRVEIYIPPKKGMTHLLRLIRELLTDRPLHRETSIAAALDFVGRVLHKRSVLFLISDFLDQGYEKKMKALAVRHDLIAIPISDPREGSLPDIGLLQLEDAESGRRVMLDTGSRAVRAGFDRWWREGSRRIDQTLISSGVDRIQLRAGEDYVKPIVRFFIARERGMR